MDFEWDKEKEKAHANHQKHGVYFAEETGVFAEEHSSCGRDPDQSHEEER
jgi:uncharacterized DUF497 family protein